MDAILQTHNLCKVFHTNGTDVEALHNVNLQVTPREFVTVMGPSGCGKSTLLHLLGGLDRPTQGEIFIDGRRMDTLNESARAVLRRTTVGFVFQAYNLIPNLTVAGNVDMPGLLLKYPIKQVKKRRQELLEALGIGDKENIFPSELSGGEMQRVAIARALMNSPSVLLVDEPTGNLDTRSGMAVMELLCRFHADRQTILLVTHDPKVASYAGRVIFMRDGQLVDEVRPAGSGNGTAILSRLMELSL